LTVQVLRLRRLFHLIIRRKTVVTVSARARRSWDGLNPRRPRSRAAPLAPYADRLRATIFPGSDLKRHGIAGLERPKTGAFDVAEVDEKVSVHRLALDEAPSMLKPGYHTGVACVVSRHGIADRNAHLRSVAYPKVRTQRAKHLLNTVDLS